MHFEYKVAGFLSEEELNELGAQGWELVSVSGSRSILKRSKSQEMPLPLNSGRPRSREKVTT